MIKECKQTLETEANKEGFSPSVSEKEYSHVGALISAPQKPLQTYNFWSYKISLHCFKPLNVW